MNLLAAAVAFAGEAAYPSSPPLSIDDAETVEKGHVEVNLSVGLEASADGWEVEAPLVDANLGVAKGVHLNAEVPLVETADGVGLGNVAAAVKIVVLDRPTCRLSIHPEVGFPAFPGIGADPSASWEATLPVIFDVALGDGGLGLGVEVAHTFTGTWADDDWTGMIGLGMPVSDDVALMVDYTQDASMELRPTDGWFEAGATIGLGEHATGLVSAGRSTTDGARAFLGVQLGF